MGAMSPAERSATAALLGGVAMPGTALGLRGVEVARRHAGFLDGLRGRPAGFPAAPATTGPAPWPPPPLPPPEQPPSPRTMALLASSRGVRGRDDMNLLDVMARPPGGIQAAAAYGDYGGTFGGRAAG